MALHATSVTSPHPEHEQIVSLLGRGRRPSEDGHGDAPGILGLQLQGLDHLVEIVRLRAEVAERDRRIANLTAGVRTWRERAIEQANARQYELAQARENEREVVSLLHHQMAVAEAVTEELERMRARSWWDRLRNA